MFCGPVLAFNQLLTAAGPTYNRHLGKSWPQSHNQSVLLIFRGLMRRTFSFRFLLHLPLSRSTKTDSCKVSAGTWYEKDIGASLTVISMDKRNDTIAKKKEM